MGTQTTLVIGQAGIEIDRCSGPTSDGSCPRVAVGSILPCSGHTLQSADASVGAQPYPVSAGATLCPVTLAAALAIDHEGGFTEDGT